MREKHLTLRAGERHLRLSRRRRHAAPSATWRWACCTSSTSRCRAASRTTSRSRRRNGYQSLHTTLVSPLGTAVEFQIRTEPMHAVAEKGIAAHWLYKERRRRPRRRRRSAWARCGCSRCSTSRTRPATPTSSSSTSRSISSPTRSTSFTPKSKILALPRGATPVDFAYAIHSDVGDHSRRGQRSTASRSPLRTELRSGDVVEIVGAPDARPNPAWLNFVLHRPGRARKIRHYLKNMEQEESQRPRREDARPGDARRGPGTCPATTGRLQPRVWQQLIRWSGNKTRDDLFTDIGLGRKIATIVATRLARLLAEDGIRPDALALTMGRYAVDDSAPAQGMVLIDGSEGASVQLRHLLPADPGRRDRRQPRPRRRADGAHRRMQRRQAPARARQRALDARSSGPSSRRARSRPAVIAARHQRQGRARAGGLGGEPRRGRHHPHRHGQRARRPRPPS